MRTLEQTAAQAVELAAKHGCRDAWAGAYASTSTYTTVRDGALARTEVNGSRILQLKLFVDGRFSNNSTTDLAPERLDAFVREAVAMTRLLQSDPHRQLPDRGLLGAASAKLDATDASVSDLSMDARIERALALDRRSHGRTGVVSTQTSFVDGHYTDAIATSNGFVGSFHSTSVSLGSAVALRDAGDQRREGEVNASALHLADLPTARELGDEVLRRARAKLGSRRGPSMTATMVVDRLASANLLYHLINPAWGDALVREASFWLDAKGRARVSPKLELVDDPLIPRAVGSRPFDSEGLTTRARPILLGGELQSGFLDTYHARRLGQKPTSGDASNIIVKPGTQPLDALIGSVRRGVYVTDWIGGDSDPATGAFSFGVQGQLIKAGKLAGPVSEINASGNLLDLFSHLQAVANDPWPHDASRVPSLAFDAVSFAGA